MEPEVEDSENNDNEARWSGSDCSHDGCISESLAESYNEDDVSGSEYPLDPQTPHMLKSDPESPEFLQSQGWESASEQRSLPEVSGSEEDVSYQEEDDIYDESTGSITESPHIQTSPTSLPPQLERHDSNPSAGQISLPHSPSSSSSLGCAADMTLALTLAREQPLGASKRQDTGTGNRRVESSEEGGSGKAPPASVFFGISDEGAEQAEKWNSESDTDLCRPDRHRTRHTRLGHNESQSERHVKETKSKCKRIARLLTDAPNPQNKGALLFKKRQQRVKKYTLVSYGTGDNKLDSEDQIEEETEEVKLSGYSFVATSDSELEDEYSVYHQKHSLSLNWGSVQEMEELPETKGKGVLMFAQRRKRIDEIVSEHEELRSKGLPVETLTEPECTEAHDFYDTKEMCMYADQANYMDAGYNQHLEYQDNIHQKNHLSNVPRPLVPNRTAKPFLGFQDGTTAPVIPGGVPGTKKHEARFKVAVPINSNPQVWSPTGDIIASRDERISVPAIKTGILPESKRKATKPSMQAKESDPRLQSKGERRSYIESEEDCFSLGAEACNFMQPRAIKLKNPPPVAPKPTVNPAFPPWLKSTSDEPYIPPRSPVSQPSHSSAGPHSQHYSQQQDWAQPQQVSNRWAPDQTPAKLQTPASAWAPVSSSSQLHLQPTANSWSQQPQRSPGFSRSRSLSLPRQLSAVSSPGLMSPVSTPGTQPLYSPSLRQVYKTPTPWEAASRSPAGSVDEAFLFQSLPSSVAYNVKAAGHRRSLPEPPDEWKRRVSLDPAATRPASEVCEQSQYWIHETSIKPNKVLSPLQCSPQKLIPDTGCALGHNKTAGDIMDLGKKLSTPKDIMLEELSLLSNRGSRLFKMRQRRSDKYTFESIQNEANAQLNNILGPNTHTVEIKVEAPALGNTENAENIVSDATAQKLNITSTSKCYHSPWEEAILSDPDLAETLKLRLPALERSELPEYKSFNRVATPYGGFEKAPRGITFKLPEVNLNPPRYPELQEPGVKRPTFNRTAQGWISEGTHLILPTVTLQSIKLPESDDL
ncbi:hypothetical protein Q5P01_025288 [Channa striata]|uniref:Uncharacterized protein n=1 Tax=Channa striata TaxID=64152 RepID=A0AA88LPG6_CHASR|nr:hypothetical protein Q5P01_025288 [Channa striata]